METTNILSEAQRLQNRFDELTEEIRFADPDERTFLLHEREIVLIQIAQTR